MRIGSVTNIYHELDLLDGCLAGLHGIDRRVVVSSKQTYQGHQADRGDLKPILSRHQAELLELDVSSQEAMRNTALGMLKDCDWVLIVDCDEYYTEEMIRQIKEKLAEIVDPKPCYTVPFPTFFRWADWKVECSVDRGSPFLLHPQKAKFVRGRMVDCDTAAWSGEAPYHFSYVRTPEQMKMKLANFSHANEILPGFYEKWLSFDGSQTDLHPTTFGVWPKAQQVSIPTEIRNRLPLWAFQSPSQ